MELASEPVEEPEVVLLIHGTGSTAEADEGERWWQRGGEFWATMNAALRPTMICGPREGPLFRWSGANSEADRREAGARLLAYLRALEGRGTRYHLVGHSHGGSVIWHALVGSVQAGRPLTNLVSWTTVGTPFLDYAPDWRRVLSALPAFIAAAILAGLATDICEFVLRADEVAQVSGLLAPAGLVLIWLLLFGVGFYCLRDLLLLVLADRNVRRRRKAAREAFARYGPLWVGIWSPRDEAINGLRTTLSEPATVAPRLGRRAEASPALRIRSALLAPFAPLYNWLVASPTDEFIWERVVGRLQGSNVLGERLETVTTGPMPDHVGWPPLPESIECKLAEWSDRHAANALAGARVALGLASQSRDGAGSLLTLIGRRLSWSELVHTSYFVFPEVRRMLLRRLARQETIRGVDAADEVGHWFASKPSAPFAPALTQLPEVRDRRPLFGRLSWVRASAVTLLSGLLWIVAGGLGNQIVTSLTDAYQRKRLLAEVDVLSAAADMLSQNVDKYNNPIAAWFEARGKVGVAPSLDEIANEAKRQAQILEDPYTILSRQYGIVLAAGKGLIESDRLDVANIYLDRAIQIVISEYAGDSLDAELQRLVPTLAQSNIDTSALEKIIWYVDEIGRDRLLVAAADGALERGNIERARYFLARISDPDNPSTVVETNLNHDDLWTIVENLSLHGALGDAQALLARIKSPWQRARALAAVAAGLDLTGRTIEAEALWNEMEQTTRRGTFADNAALERIAGWLAAAGRTDRALEILRSSETTWISRHFKGSSELGSYEHTGATIVRHLTVKGKLDEAITVLKDMRLDYIAIANSRFDADTRQGYVVMQVSQDLVKALQAAGREKDAEEIWKWLEVEGRNTNCNIARPVPDGVCLGALVDRPRRMVPV